MSDAVKPTLPGDAIVNPKGHHHSSHPHHKVTGHGIWSWDTTVSIWILIEDKAEPGFEAGPGPTGPGRFHGQTVRWACVPSEE